MKNLIEDKELLDEKDLLPMLVNSPPKQTWGGWFYEKYQTMMSWNFFSGSDNKQEVQQITNNKLFVRSQLEVWTFFLCLKIVF